MTYQSQAAAIEPAPVAVVEEADTAQLIRCTCYLDRGLTATGTTTHWGVAAGCRDWFGETVYLYTNDNGTKGEFIGAFVIEDTGFGIKLENGRGSLEEGLSIDIWQPSEEAMNKWIKTYGDYVFIEFEQKN